MTETATPLLPLVLSLALAGGAALAAELTECGQAVPAGEIGELRANLVECAAAADPLHLSARGVLVGRAATLNLNGFTIAGDGQ